MNTIAWKHCWKLHSSILKKTLRYVLIFQKEFFSSYRFLSVFCFLWFSGSWYFRVRQQHKHREDHVPGNPGRPVLLLFFPLHLRWQEERVLSHSLRNRSGNCLLIQKASLFLEAQNFDLLYCPAFWNCVWRQKSEMGLSLITFCFFMF